MPFTLAGQLAQKTPAARATDPLGLVAETLRNSSQGAVPIFATDDLRQSRVVGLVSQADLARASAPLLEPVAALNGHAQAYLDGHAASELAVQTPQETLRALTARDVMQRDVPFIPAQFSLLNALMMLDRHSAVALPVLEADGSYRGLITRADVLAALTGQVKPPLIGGMATPLGVWLTDGRLSGGVPPFALFLSGLTMAFCFLVAQLATVLIARALDPSWGALAVSGRLGANLDGSGLLNTLFFGLHSLIFLSLFRVLPISGIHAAEHQTVHALERGLPLTVENVAKMPRAHPRCGTNIAAFTGLVLIGVSQLPSFDPQWVVLVLLATFFGWRFLGEWLQIVFLTRPASRKQIESGIKAANELMQSYQQQPFATRAQPHNVMFRAMFLSALGFAGTVSLVAEILDRLLR